MFGPAVQSSWNTTEIRALGMPAGGSCTSAADLALLYQPLLNRGQVYGGGQILQPETIARATTQTTDNHHFAYLFAPPAENPDRVPTDTDIRVPKLRGWVVELMGNDALTLTFEEEDDSNTSVELTLWGKTAEEFEPEAPGEAKHVVVIRKAKVSDWNGAR